MTISFNKSFISVIITIFLATLYFSLSIYGDEGEEFPHDAHLEDVECTDCHKTAKDDDAAGYPTEEVCTDCHDDTLGVDIASLSSRKRPLHSEFPHTAHTDFECNECHGDLSEDDPKIIGVDECFECHLDNDLELSCKDCHNYDMFIPAYHKIAGKWKKRHGFRVKTRLKSDHRFDCAVCHTDDSCKKCHQLKKPRDHNGYWNRRGHAIKAKLNRESCGKCHNEIFCIRCHKNTKPLNHRNPKWNSVHAISINGNSYKRCSICHPRVITRVNAGDDISCRYCHPR